MVVTFFVKLACNVLGNVYPAYASYKAVLSGDVAQHRQWLSYWVVNAVFIVFEMFADRLISWLPLYYEGKLAFIVWLTLYQGAGIIYDRLVQRYLALYEHDLDAHLATLHESASQVGVAVRGQLVESVRASGAQLIRAVATTAASNPAMAGALVSVMSPEPTAVSAATPLPAVTAVSTSVAPSSSRPTTHSRNTSAFAPSTPLDVTGR